MITSSPSLTAAVDMIVDGRIEHADIPALTALNQDLRSEYFTDCNNGVRRWNRILDEAGVETTLPLPHHGFNRRVGAFAGYWVTPGGALVDAGPGRGENPNGCRLRRITTTSSRS